MSNSLDEQIEQLKNTIAEMESQRAVLGEATVEAALVPLKKRLAELEAPAEPPQEEPPEIPTLQRKLATILFMDVVGSTEMTHDLDPEDQMALVDPLIARLAEKVSEFGGHVARYTGDGFKAVFGLPLARENDPEQAIRAGLAIQSEASEIAAELGSEQGITDFKVRLGITTGLVFAGGETEGEDTIKGNPVNLAARLQSAAPPGGLLISHNTYRHVRGVFNVEPLEPIAAKGFPEPVPVYLVREVKPRAFRVLTRGVEGVETRMVGRETELKRLQDGLLTAIEEGEGQVVTITGEAGVGKSRLLYEFENWIELLPSTQAVYFFQGRGRQEAQGLPYSLLRDLFSFRFQILDDDTGEQARRKIEMGFCDGFGEGEEGFMKAHILGQLLGFDFSASPHLKGVLNDAEQLRNRAMMYLVQYFQVLSKQNPILIFLEDIHWGDDSSLDVVMRLGEKTPQLRLLIVGAGRPTLFERRPYWGEGQAYHTLLELNPLSKRESRQLVTEILKLAEDIPAELRELVVSGAEGNPFYLEELIKMLIEDGVVIPGEDAWGIDLNRLEQVDVPSTLAGVLQARLDSLPVQERTILQQASVVGRLFWDRIVSYIQAERGDRGDPGFIPVALSSLRDRELIYRHEESAFVGAAEYLFKHDVLREVTYESVLKRLRKNYHGLVADWLIANSGDRIAEYSGLIAEHLLLSGREELVGDYFKQAGDSALASFANIEAEMYYQRALEFTTSAPLRAAILAGLGKAQLLQGRRDEASQAWRGAIILYKEIGDRDHLGEAYADLATTYHLIDDLKAWDVSQEGLHLLEGAAKSPGYAQLLGKAGRCAWFINLNDEARSLCQQAIEMADRLGESNTSADARITLAFLEADIAKSLSILNQVIELSETNRLLDSAARAHNNLGYFHDEYLIDLDSSRRHYLQAAELDMKIGDPEPIVAYSNAYESTVKMGELELAEQMFNQFFSKPARSGTLKEYYERVNRIRILTAKGKWGTAFEIVRDILQEFGESYQRSGSRNIDLALASLELNRFGMMTDLSEAKSALKENLEMDHRSVQSNYLLATVYTRQGRMQEAHAQFDLPMRDRTFHARDNNRYIASRAMAATELAMAEGRWMEAIAASESAIAVFEECSYKLWWARQLIDLGDAYIGRDEPGDLEQAREIYQQSLDMFTEMGAPGYIQVLEERLRLNH